MVSRREEYYESGCVVYTAGDVFEIETQNNSAEIIIRSIMLNDTDYR